MLSLFGTILLVFVLIALVLTATVLLVWRRELRTLASFRQVDGNPYLYTLEYQARYDLDDMLARNVDTYGGLLGYILARGIKILPTRWMIDLMHEKLTSAYRGGCTSFQAGKTDGNGYLFGRNYDYYKNPTLVTTSHPKKGYASISTADMSFMGYNLESLPKTFLKRFNSLAAIYTPLDGINEKGLCVSILALPPDFAVQQETGRHTVGTSTIVRLMLDRCATVGEALALLETVDLRQDINFKAAFHYMVADAAGDAAVIEFDPQDDWKTLVVRKADGARHLEVTNHMLAPGYASPVPDPAVGNVGSRSWWRRQCVDEFLSERSGGITVEEALDCLSAVRWIDLPVSNCLATGTQYHLKFKRFKARLEKRPDREHEDTQYSAVYDQGRIALTLRNWNDYDTAHTFTLDAGSKAPSPRA